MASSRRTAIVIGMLYLITHVTSIVGLSLYGPVLTSTTYAEHLTAPDASGNVLVGALLEIVLALAIVGTGVMLYPVVKPLNEGMALGYAALRTLEAAVIAVGVTPMIAAVALVQSPGAAGAADKAGLVQALAAVHNWTFLVGPGFICAANTAVLAAVLLRSGIVPRFVPILGLVGSPLLFASSTAQILGAIPQTSPWAGVAAAPVFAWEISLALFLIIRGFRAGAMRRAPAAVQAASA